MIHVISYKQTILMQHHTVMYTYKIK